MSVVNYKIGIDLGGTKIEGILLDENNNERFRDRIPTQSEKGYDHVLNSLASFIKMIENKADKPCTVGIGIPGAIVKKTGLVKNSNTVCLNAKPFQTDLEKLLGRATAFENDANCFAMAEAVQGAGKGYDLVFGVIMGTGCGGGLVINGKVHTGKHTLGGEWGHHTINYVTGPVCFTGKRGCAEAYISGSGLEARYFERYGEKRSLKDITTEWREGNPKLDPFYDEFFMHYGIAMGNLINILDPDCIVLGGGLSNMDELYDRGREEVEKYVLTDDLETPIIKNQLGDSAGVFGAAFIGI